LVYTIDKIKFFVYFLGPCIFQKKLIDYADGKTEKNLNRKE